MLIDLAKLESDYYAIRPDPANPAQRVSFGTSGHRGSPFDGSFNEVHILAIAQAICDYRKGRGIDGPLFVAKDTHAADTPAERTALEVFAANKCDVRVQPTNEYTPTPALSHAILTWNRGLIAGLADGVVITPSHNPPRDGGFKYNSTNGGPADLEITSWVEARANELIGAGNAEVRRSAHPRVTSHDFATPYIDDLANVIDLDAIRASGLRIGADPMGGASVGYWARIGERYGLDLTVTNPNVDMTFSFMTVDHDGKIRMDCSSPWAMASLIHLKDRFDIAFGNDTDADRHGIVCPSVGLLNPNHYLAASIQYLFTHRTGWPATAAVGKTLVSSGIIDRVAASLERKLIEVPVGFKWFTRGLMDGSLGFGGEESAGASFLRKDGTVWTTDKDGIILSLLAAEMTASTGKDPGQLFAGLAERFGRPYYARIDRPALPAQKAALKKISPEMVLATELAGEPITARLTRAPGNDEPIGGLKVTTQNGWFAARPSGTEDVYKIYAESMTGEAHLQRILDEAGAIVDRVLKA